MNSDGKVELSVRLEDAVALAFFLLNLLMKLIFSELRGANLSPADVLIIIPAVALLMAKELVHYFMTRHPSTHTEGDLHAFAWPYWEIIRDWTPFLIILM